MAVEGGAIGVLVLHGFSGSPWEVRPVSERLAGLGWSVAMPVLAGHADRPEALAASRWPDWLASAMEALDWLAARTERQHICGLSMGGLLTLELARSRRIPRPGGLALLAPALDLPAWQKAGLRWLDRLGWNGWFRKGDPHLPGALRQPGDPVLPLRAAASLVALADRLHAAARPLPLPLLALHGDRDPTIPHDLARRRFQPWQGPNAQWRTIPGARHLLPRDVAGPEVVAQVQAFLQQGG
jgi:carboxylesterase